MASNPSLGDRIQGYLRMLTPQARSRLLTELERLHVSGEAMPGFDPVLSGLRAEVRSKGEPQDRVGNASRYFFQPLEPVLVERTPESANSGQISRGSLATVWSWIGEKVLPTMMRDYNNAMKNAIGSNDLREAQKLAAIFQGKVVKYLENTLKSDEGTARIRDGLSIYTSSRAAFDDLIKIMRVLQTGDALTKFNAALPPKIGKLAGATLAELRGAINALGAKHGEAVPFALHITARHLKRPRELIYLAVPDRKAATAAAAPIPLAVKLVVDQIDEKRVLLIQALKARRTPLAKDILGEIDDVEETLRDHADLLAEQKCEQRLDELMSAVADIVEREIQSIPGEVAHILASRRTRRGSIGQRFTSMLKSAMG
jgi:hypothetical protein